jgi:TRAP-type C4-dicarboxylate transport system permease small subunit
MTPLSFEWQWNIDYFIFMGFLYLALLVIGIGLTVAYIRAWFDAHQEEKGETEPPEISSRSKYAQY